MSIADNIKTIRATLPPSVTLVNVSKFQPIEAIQEAYDCGERDFGESRVQELIAKHEALPKDIRWHFIGHLQTNKVKYIVPFVHLIQSVDSWHLLEVINAEAAKVGRVIDVLLEVHVAKEETKTGFVLSDLSAFPPPRLSALPNIRLVGFMAMATNTNDETEIRRCFREVKSLAASAVLSIGMSDDYLIAIEEGSTMVRIGSRIFGERK